MEEYLIKQTPVYRGLFMIIGGLFAVAGIGFTFLASNEENAGLIIVGLAFLAMGLLLISIGDKTIVVREEDIIVRNIFWIPKRIAKTQIAKVKKGDKAYSDGTLSSGNEHGYFFFDHNNRKLFYIQETTVVMGFESKNDSEKIKRLLMDVKNHGGTLSSRKIFQ